MGTRPTSSALLVEKSMRVADVIALCPEARDVLAEYGLHCAGCAYNGLESLEEGCQSHGFDDGEINDLVLELNEMLEAAPQRPQSLILTEPAATAILGIMKEEKRLKEGLAVELDAQGGFCMEFRANPLQGEKVFGHTNVPEVRIFASKLTLQRIGGSTIDFRDGRFKLDVLSTDTDKKGCACGGSCSCTSKN